MHPSRTEQVNIHFVRFKPSGHAAILICMIRAHKGWGLSGVPKTCPPSETEQVDVHHEELGSVGFKDCGYVEFRNAV